MPLIRRKRQAHDPPPGTATAITRNALRSGAGRTGPRNAESGPRQVPWPDRGIYALTPEYRSGPELTAAVASAVEHGVRAVQ